MPVITNLEAYWPMDEGSGNAIDAHAALDLTDNGGVGTAAGKVATARDFVSGEGDFFSYVDDPAFSRGDTNFSFAGWFFADDLASYRGLIIKADATSNNEYALYVDPTGTALNWAVSGDGTSNSFAPWSSPLSTGVWYFIVVWHDADNNQIGISVNNGTAVTSAHSTGVFNGNTPFNIGAQNSASIHYEGLIDEVGMWSKVLSGAEITWLYNSGNGRSYADIVAEASEGGTPFFTYLGAQRIRR